MDNNKEVPSFDLDRKMYLMLLFTAILMLLFIFFANDFINYISRLKI